MKIRPEYVWFREPKHTLLAGIVTPPKFTIRLKHFVISQPSAQGLIAETS
jgi:hypothetical protein